ncbi:uncharacterized protein Aud_004549 [Aspergillus udagawae]|uniref:Uncharacterized protein n=1 Tax=Aspergillus udagawae TaxID=91492 RepID=A0A8E0QPB2_9EURO|nr:uncharacterized protein Aud_004549 [Aspergillus udagawae]GIC88158.1 hypothetical protein Aud_004549 [Aspergillus udagawae]
MKNIPGEVLSQERDPENPSMPQYERLIQRRSIEYGDSYHDSGTDDGVAIPNACKRYRTSRLQTKDIFILLLASFGLIDLGLRALALLRLRRYISCNCGDTIQEARNNNCRYDSFAAAWLPPACRNDELLEQFERAGPNTDGSWPYYADKNGTKVLSLEQVSMLPEMGGHFFATHQWHLVHCAYYWKKMFLASKTGTVIEHRYNNLAHINHCEMMFLKRDPLDKIVTEAGVSLHSDRIVIAKSHAHGSDHEGNHSY